MGSYKEVEGDLIKLALQGEFDVIAHGCNCFNTMGAGIAVPMAKTFGCDRFPKEFKQYKGSYNKLGQISYATTYLKEGEEHRTYLVNKVNNSWEADGWKKLFVVNAYTQYGMGKFNATNEPDLDYDALSLCLKKLNAYFRGDKIGLPQIGCGLAGGDWLKVKALIQEHLKDCDVTAVIFKP